MSTHSPLLCGKNPGGHSHTGLHTDELQLSVPLAILSQVCAQEQVTFVPLGQLIMVGEGVEVAVTFAQPNISYRKQTDKVKLSGVILMY